MIAEIITPLMLTIAPSMQEVQPVSYDWKNQISLVQMADGSFKPTDLGTSRGTFSFIPGTTQQAVDDFQQD